MNKFETRSIQELKASEGKLVGYAARFDSRSVDLGGFYEVIRPGAFTRTLRDNPDVRALVEHDPSLGVLGRTSAGTLKLEEDSRGLRVEITPPDTSAGRDIVESVRRGDVDAMSFAFVVEKEEFDYTGDIPVRYLSDVTLREVSIVTFPAYPDTSIALRHLEDARPVDLGGYYEVYGLKLDLLDRS